MGGEEGCWALRRQEWVLGEGRGWALGRGRGRMGVGKVGGGFGEEGGWAGKTVMGVGKREGEREGMDVGGEEEEWAWGKC